MKTVIGVVALALIAGGIYLLNDLVRRPDGQSMLHVAREPEVPVQTAAPRQRDIIRTVQAPGDVEAFAEVDIRSEVVAKIIEMPVEEGDFVQQGSLLCRLDDADFRARVLSAQANVAKLGSLIVQAEADLTTAERDWDQAQRLRETNASSEMELANYRAALIKARALVDMRQQELIEAQAALQSAQENLGHTVIESPLTGVVSQRFAKQGEVVVTGTMNNPGTRIMVVTDLSKMQVRCRVDEADAPLVAPDQPARIYLQSDTRRSVPGQVLRVGTKGTKPLGRDVVTFETIVLITGEDPRVMPGMSANIEIEVARRENALTVPVQTVVYRKRRDLPETLAQEYDRQQSAQDPGARQNVAEYVRLIFCAADGKARPHLVQVGISDANDVEIVSGLALTDTVISGPYRSLDQLKDGTAVKNMELPKTGPPGAPLPEEQPPTTAPASAPASAPAAAPAAADPDEQPDQQP